MIDIIQARFFDSEGIPAGLMRESLTGSEAIVECVTDIVLALLILLVISPLLNLIALGIKWRTPGPVIFKQFRYGLDGEEISVYNFRSKTVTENGSQIVQATRNDPRIPPFGAFLRKKH